VVKLILEKQKWKSCPANGKGATATARKSRESVARRAFKTAKRNKARGSKKIGKVNMPQP